MNIARNIEEINSTIPEEVKLVAVSKTKSNEEILEAYHAGQRIFGENKARELAQKYDELPKDIEWHFIGHLQTNKVKYIAPFIRLMHGADSLKILKVLNKEARKNNRVIPCLLQFHIAEEETKFGLSPDEAKELLESDDFKRMNNISVSGVMGMATFTDNQDKIRAEFRKLKSIFHLLKREYFAGAAEFREISMGMSDDYQLAIEEGSTMVRVGSKIFGERNY